MSPNAIGNAQALQTAQLEELREKLSIKGEVHEKTINYLRNSIALSSFEGPMTTAMERIAQAICNLSQAQLVLAEYTVNEINSQIANLDEAIAKSKSPIARATLTW
jgi:hypothetical protein